jgi:hypothetical protein
MEESAMHTRRPVRCPRERARTNHHIPARVYDGLFVYWLTIQRGRDLHKCVRGENTRAVCNKKQKQTRETCCKQHGPLTHMHGLNAVRSTAQQAGNRASAGSVRRLTVCGVTIEHGENTQSALPFHNMPVYSFHALHNRPTNNRIMISSTGVLSSPLSILERQQNAKNRS